MRQILLAIALVIRLVTLEPDLILEFNVLTASVEVQTDAREGSTSALSAEMVTVCEKFTSPNIFVWGTSVSDGSIPSRVIEAITTDATTTENTVASSTPSSSYIVENTESTVETGTADVLDSTGASNADVLDSASIADVLDSTGAFEASIADIPNPPLNSTFQANESDDLHFMSFEEWKKNKAENETLTTKLTEPKKLNETKIKVNETSTNKSLPVEVVPPNDDDGRVYKDKFNYASVDCAATVVKTNSQAKGARAILLENKDSYLLNQCSIANKFVIIELCQDILVDSVTVGNFEFFSSTFKDIRVLVSDRFPAASWLTLGEFQAKNIRDVQLFKIENPLIWARYLQLEILSHYGNEFYCPISVVRVHGKTMIEELKEGEEVAVKEDTFEDIELAESPLSDKEECRVVLPHLGLNQFLKEMNSSEYCAAITTSTTTIEETQTPQTQDSVYKNIMKRLSLLESNATLSLLYVEEQSKLLSSAFTNLERRQQANFQNLVEAFNTLVVNQLEHFKKSYANMHGEYERLFKIQELNHENSIADSRRTVSGLASDASFQKKMTLFNTLVIICLLVYVVLTQEVSIDEDYVKPKRVRKTRQFTVKRRRR